MKRIIFIFIVIFSFYSCEEQEEGDSKYFPLSKSLLDYNFSSGSYWIYKNQNEEIDSVYLSSNSKSWKDFSVDDKNKEYYEVKTFNFHSSANSYYKNISYINSIMIGDNSPYGDTIYNQNTPYLLIEKLKVGDYTFQNVECYQNFNNKFIENCFKERVGIIKYLIPIDSTNLEEWELISYSVEIENEF